MFASCRRSRKVTWGQQQTSGLCILTRLDTTSKWPNRIWPLLNSPFIRELRIATKSNPYLRLKKRLTSNPPLLPCPAFHLAKSYKTSHPIIRILLKKFAWLAKLLSLSTISMLETQNFQSTSIQISQLDIQYFYQKNKPMILKKQQTYICSRFVHFHS